ncbi:MAG: iron-containing alcohol dehydrogenase [Clostridia bacterium]|nr:iron-containing alcohol dehydrogenase [Clostridia bacterium]
MSYYEYHVARRYVQFEGALHELANYASLVGRRVLILTACDPVTEQIKQKIQEGIDRPAAAWMNERLAKESVRYARYVPMAERMDALRSEMSFSFRDIAQLQITRENVRMLAEQVQAQGFDTVVGVGGGKGQDFARALTHFLPVKVILVPTLAATNASISTLSVLYTPDGRIDQYWRMDNAPELVLADTEVLIQNPPPVLSAGIGDIMSTYYEALCNFRITGRTDVVPAFSLRGVQASIEIMKEQAPLALKAVEAREITPAFENVLSMILHNCGPLGMICTTGYAHILDEMFLYFEASHRIPHGLRVGYATIPMLCRQGADDAEIREYIDFCKSSGIPTTLGELGLEGVSRDAWRQAFDATLGSSQNHRSLPFPTSFDDLYDSLVQAQRFA